MPLKGKKKNVAGIRFRRPGSAPTTEPNQLGRPRRLRCLIAAFRRQSMPATQDQSRAPSQLEGALSIPALRAAAYMQGCNTAAQIFKLNFIKSCCTHHASQLFLVGKFPD